MSLPVAIARGFYSVVQKGSSPNGITSNPDSSKKPLIVLGYIDATDNTGTSQYSAGQYIWYRVHEEQVIVGYAAKIYIIINEKDILFAENPVIPPP